MSSLDLYEEVTALVDNEINDPNRKEELEYLLEMNEDLAYEYNIQSRVKKLLNERYCSTPAPSYLYDSVLEQITSKKAEEPFELETPGRIRVIFQTIFRPKYSLALIFTFLLIFLLSSPFQNYSVDELINQQDGKYNFWVQANNNFEGIISGNIHVQIATADPEEIINYFRETGVDYSTRVPKSEKFILAGAVVSEDKGRKFAHHIYTDETGHIIYLYQVNERYLSEKGVLKLSNDMLDYLEDGNLLKKQLSDHITYLWKDHDQYFALASNDEPSKVEKYLIAQLM